MNVLALLSVLRLTFESLGRQAKDRSCARYSETTTRRTTSSGTTSEAVMTTGHRLISAIVLTLCTAGLVGSEIMSHRRC